MFFRNGQREDVQQALEDAQMSALLELLNELDVQLD